MIYVGTCGYSYKDWVGPFYPPGTKDSQMLEYYTQNFGFVEINSSFYHMPSIRLFDSIAKRTPAGFKTAVKLFQGFTHAPVISENEGRQMTGAFMQAISPLTNSGRLASLLVQFPYSFHCNKENGSYLRKLKSWFGNDIPMNIEFRNEKWMRSEVLTLLKNEGLGVVCVDEPAIAGLIRPVTATTSGVSYVRLHGRNADAWYGSQGSERYDYLYSKDELNEWVPRIQYLDAESDITLVALNNHPKGKAVENARMLLKYLSV